MYQLVICTRTSLDVKFFDRLNENRKADCFYVLWLIFEIWIYWIDMNCKTNFQTLFLSFFWFNQFNDWIKKRKETLLLSARTTTATDELRIWGVNRMLWIANSNIIWWFSKSVLFQVVVKCEIRNILSNNQSVLVVFGLTNRLNLWKLFNKFTFPIQCVFLVFRMGNLSRFN